MYNETTPLENRASKTAQKEEIWEGRAEEVAVK